MKKFSFRLEKVLTFRKHLETKAQIGLFEAVDERRRKEDAVKSIESVRRKFSGKCDEEKRDGMSVFRYRLYRDFLQKLNDDRKTADAELTQADLSVGRKRELLRKESMKKKALEKLKEIQGEKHRVLSDKEEQKDMDETAIISRGDFI